MNRTDQIGNLVAAPTLHTLETGRQVANLRLATHEPYLDRHGEWQQRTEFHQVAIWGPSAARAAERLRKGDQVQVCGRIAYDEREVGGLCHRNAVIEVSSKRHWWKLLRRRRPADEAPDSHDSVAEQEVDDAEDVA